MILTTHALVGAALGKNISNPWLVALLAIPLHFALDHLRHGEYVDRSKKVKDIWWKILLDLTFAAVVLTVFFFFQPIKSNMAKNIMIGVTVSILPDFINFIYWQLKLPFLKKINKFHSWCHKYPIGAKERDWNLRNSLNDIAISLISIAILFL